MKKLITIISVILMLLTSMGIAFAQEEAGVAEVSETVDETTETEVDISDVVDGTEEVSVTPDSPLWGIKLAIEKIDLALTFDRSAKAQKGLRHARERLVEVQMMLKEGKFEKAAKAQEEHGKTIVKVKKDLDKIKAKHKEKVKAEGVEELEEEIEVEIEEGKAKVEIKIGENEQEFELETTDPEAIVDEIVSKTGLDREKVKKVVKFELEDEAEEDLEEDVDRNIAALEAVKAKLEAKGVPTHGIENALAIAKARTECRSEIEGLIEKRRAGEEIEEGAIAKVKAECREEIKKIIEERRERISELKEKLEERRGKRLLEKEAEEELEEETEESEETEETASEGASTETTTESTPSA